MSTIQKNNMARTIEMHRHARGRQHDTGFTLIELLTVIAIIAILSAILFAAFAGAREKARQGTAIDNMHRIQQGLAAYYLDHRRQYPPVLFAYSDGKSTMNSIKSAGPAYLQGLYPQYINDPAVFTDPDNKANDPNTPDSVSVNVNILQAGGTLAAKSMSFFVADAYDTSPQLLGANKVGPQNVARYEPAWTNLPPPAGAGYQRQLALPNSTDDTYVTMTTYHVPNANKVIVLFKNGTTKVYDTSKLLSANCGDVSDVTTTSSKFWQIQPDGNCL